MNLGIIQISNKNAKRKKLLVDKLILQCIKASDKNYTLVAPHDEELKLAVEEKGGIFFSVYSVGKRYVAKMAPRAAN